MEITKTCNKCNKAKTLDLFYANKKYELGVIGTCIECRKILSKSYRASEHGQNVRIANYNANKEIIIEKSKIYREKNKKELSKKKKEYRLANLELKRSQAKLYYKNNTQKTLDVNKQYRKNNPEKMRELSKKDYERSSQNLTDRYLKNVMKKHHPSIKEFPQEIIELKRIIIKTYRLCQQLQN